MNLFRSKLTKRYLLITLVVVLFVLSSIYALTVQVMNNSVQEQIKYRDEVIARTLSKRIESMMKKIVNDMRIVSQYLTVDSDKNRLFYLSEMERIVSYDPLYLFIRAFDRNGKPLVNVPEMDYAHRVDISSIHKRLAWSKTFYISNIVTLPNGGKSLMIAYPSVDRAGTYQGGVVAFLNLNVLSDFLRELKIGKQGMNAVIDRAGFVIGHSNAKKIGFSLTHHRIGTYLYKEKYGMWQGSLFNEKMLVAYRPILLGNMGLIVGEPVEQAMESSRNVTVLLFQGFLIVLLIAVGLSLYGASRVVKPIMQLIKQAKEYRENKRRSFDPIYTKDELQTLAQTMDQMARELTHKERRLFYILESIPYAVITTDKDGKITTFNRSAEALTLFRREEVLGKYIIDIPLKENEKEFFSWKTLREGKEFDEVESYILDKNKKKYDVMLYSSLFRGEDYQIVGAILIIRDVSELKKMEAYMKQNERLASLGQMTAGIAHEIKNPLSIIQAAAEAIQMELKEEANELPLVSEWTSDILESSDRMNDLLTDFLKLAKGENDGINEPVNLLHVMDELIYLLRKKIYDQGITVSRQYGVCQALVYGNKSRLAQVFLNIFLNSLQEMESGGILSLKISDRTSEWVIEIEDTGTGIEAAKLPWIFNPFYSTKREGTGLGLSVAHEIILQHGGTIHAESAEGQGTTMIVYVPKGEREEG
jgi:PAS domain S-box-containing protein